MFLERIERGDPETFEYTGHTDDEDDEDLESEDLGPLALAPAPAPAPASPEPTGRASPSPSVTSTAHSTAASISDDDFTAASGPQSPLTQDSGGSVASGIFDEAAPAPAPETDHPLPVEGRPPKDPRRPPPEWDPSLRSPIFFGYLDTSVQDIRDQEDEARAAREQVEDEVAERKREERWAAIDKFREDSKSKKFFRDKKLSDLENKHDRERRKRDNEYRGRRKVCATEAERLQLDARYEADEEAATATCELEADTLHKANSVRDSFEAQELERMQNEADQIDGAEKFTAPGGEEIKLQAPFNSWSLGV